MWARLRPATTAAGGKLAASTAHPQGRWQLPTPATVPGQRPNRVCRRWRSRSSRAPRRYSPPIACLRSAMSAAAHRRHGNLTSTPPGDLWCGWTLRDTSAHVYHLGTFHLAAGGAVKIHTGRGPTPRPTGTRTPATTSGTTPATPQPSRTPTTSSSTAATTPPPPTPKRPADQRCLRQDASRLGSSWCAPREPGDHCEGVA